MFSRRRFLQGRTLSDGVKEVAWLRPDGEEMTEPNGTPASPAASACTWRAPSIERVDKRGKPVRDDNFLVLFNAHHEEIPFLLPEFHAGGAWQVVLDTAKEQHPFEQKHFDAGAQYPLQGRSMAVLRATTPHAALSHRHAAAPATQPPRTVPHEPSLLGKSVAATQPTPSAAQPQPDGSTPPEPAPQVPASAAPAKPTEPLPEKLGEDSKGG